MLIKQALLPNNMFEGVKKWGTATITSIMLALGVAGCEPPTRIEFEEETAENFYSDLPNETSLLQPEHQTEVSDSVERFYDLKPAIEIILENSPDLPDIYGEGIYDNEEFLFCLDDMVDRFFDFYFPCDRLLGYDSNNPNLDLTNVDYDVAAVYFYNPEDDTYLTSYIGFDMKEFPSGSMEYFPPRTCTTLHEIIHSEQREHSDAIHEKLTELSQQEEVTYDDLVALANLALDKYDSAYTTTFLVDPVDLFSEYVEEEAVDCEDSDLTYFSKEEWVEITRQYEYFRVYTEAFRTSEQGITEVLEHFYDTGLEVYEQTCE